MYKGRTSDREYCIRVACKEYSIEAARIAAVTSVYIIDYKVSHSMEGFKTDNGRGGHYTYFFTFNSKEERNLVFDRAAGKEFDFSEEDLENFRLEAIKMGRRLPSKKDLCPEIACGYCGNLTPENKLGTHESKKICQGCWQKVAPPVKGRPSSRVRVMNNHRRIEKMSWEEVHRRRLERD